jgi:hypothetical protein
MQFFGGCIIIYHVDGNQRAQGISSYPISTETHFKVALLPADRRYDIELGNNIGDETDFWELGMVFGPSTDDFDTSPNSDSYDYGPTGIHIQILNITEGDDTAHATIQFFFRNVVGWNC